MGSDESRYFFNQSCLPENEASFCLVLPHAYIPQTNFWTTSPSHAKMPSAKSVIGGNNNLSLVVVYSSLSTTASLGALQSTCIYLSILLYVTMITLFRLKVIVPLGDSVRSYVDEITSLTATKYLAKTKSRFRLTHPLRDSILQQIVTQLQKLVFKNILKHPLRDSQSPLTCSDIQILSPWFNQFLRKFLSVSV